MSQLGTYTFLPWARQGIANKITAADLDPAVKLRATIAVQLQLTAQKLEGGTQTADITKDIQLYGPGDIVGIDKKAIIKTEPHNGITNFEPNYLAFIDFYNENLLWCYSPAAPDKAKDRLRPWITLVVLKEDEFKDGKNIKDKPLPFIEVENAADTFPAPDQLWAWAHVHVNRSLDDPIVSTDKSKIAEELSATLREDADLAYSRLICPRRLEAKTSYHAFVIPTFESGRLAGLGLDPGGAPMATTAGWEEYEGKAAPAQFPYYHRWYFRTGEIGDFEYLVRLLEPRPVDSRVGRRDMDVQRPGSNLPGIDRPEPGGVLRLGGALRVPLAGLTEEEREEVERFDNWADPYPQDFQEKLAEFINLRDAYTEKTAETANAESGLDLPEDNDPDPMITPPLYGRWHALAERLLKDREGDPLPNNQNWVHDLNLDPRWRVAAGFGTKIIQQNQEAYMDAAWDQLGDVLEANRRIRQAQLAKEVSWTYYHKQLRPLLSINTERTFLLTAPLQKRVVADGLTVGYQVKTSRITPAATSAAMRRIIRPRGRLIQSLEFNEDVTPSNLIDRINEGDVTAAPPKKTPEGIPTLDEAAEGLRPKNVPEDIVDLLDENPWMRFLPLILIVLVLVIVLLFFRTGAGIGVGAAVIGGLLYLYRLLSNWSRQIEVAESVTEEKQTPESVDDLPSSPDFRLVGLDESFTPSTGNTDSAVATRFKTALRDSYSLLQASATLGEKPERPKVDLPKLTTATFQAINPELTVPARTYATIFLPPRIVDLIGEQFVEPMAYPEFDIPMYRPLVEESSELFLPNINFIEQNTISLLETNQRFIESYMVGLNHEFGRELLWREYVTDQRGSYFRQFWDVSAFLDTKDRDEEERREQLRDIPPLHKWSKTSDLGDHDHRERPGDNEEEVVLVIRGELLKKYPTAVIYAQRARWQTKDDSDEIDKTKPRDLVTLTEVEETNPPREKIRTPLYEAKVDPDIYFFGFDLTVEEAKGQDDDPGWFFVIKERPGEPRFGLDLDGTENPHFWNDLSWNDVETPEGNHLEIGNLPDFALTEPPDGMFPGSDVQYDEDVQVNWNADMNAAELAYILYQVPVLVGIHASEMLPK